MRAYFQIFFSLLIPLSIFFTIASMVYFGTEYDFSKSMRLGVLTGAFIGLFSSLFTALFIFVSRRGTSKIKASREKRKNRATHTTQAPIETIHNIQQRKNRSSQAKQAHHEPTKTTHTVEQNETEETKHPVQEEVKPQKPSISKDSRLSHTVILLMDKELAVEVALYAISDQDIGTLTQSENSEDAITIKNNDELIQIAVSSLTRHTCEFTVTSNRHTDTPDKIIRYMKEKEHSFIQY